MKQGTFIPVDNNIDKALAFAPSLREEYFDKVRMPKPKDYMNPLDTIQNLQEKGWHIEGVSEKVGHDRRVTHNQVRLYHPDIAMQKPSGKLEGTSNVYITNSLSDSKLELALGMYRLVCSNGMIAFRGDRYNASNPSSLEISLDKIEREAQELMVKFSSLKEYNLTDLAQRDLAKKALRTRFSGGMANNIAPEQLLQCHRDDDAGNDVWSIYNRLQENLIKPNMIKNLQGGNVVGVYDMHENVRINTALYTNVIDPLIQTLN